MGLSVYSVERRARSSSILPRLILAGASAALLAACSTDTSRLAENPFGTSDRMATGSTTTGTGASWLPPADVGAGGMPSVAPAASPIASAPLPAASPIQSSPLPPLGASRPNPSFSAPAVSSPRLASAVPAAAAPIATGTARNLATSGNWTAEGGTPIVVAQGETAEMLGARYGVPATALLAVNGLNSASQVQPGARMIIPVYNASRAAGKKTAETKPAPTAAPSKPAQAAAVPATPAARPGRLQLVKGPEAAKPADKPAKAAEKPAKAAKPAEKPAKVAEAPRAAEKPAEKPRKATEAAAPAEQPKPVKTAKAEPAKEAAAPAADPEPTGSLPQEGAAGSKPEFRWPARGRIIQGYKKGSSDGINIAVPEGTPVKAAEAGTVAYAGSELKGYGNLVLVRHPNGYVSAYAHNGELNVKRGDQIRRGQVIAKSGKTGNVSSPQIHFELRKGSTPVDPTEYLAGM
jgi:murein DD-endopeptidase MepM/ murein hydrolase activator NlpD